MRTNRCSLHRQKLFLRNVPPRKEWRTLWLLSRGIHPKAEPGTGLRKVRAPASLEPGYGWADKGLGAMEGGYLRHSWGSLNFALFLGCLPPSLTLLSMITHLHPSEVACWLQAAALITAFAQVARSPVVSGMFLSGSSRPGALPWPDSPQAGSPCLSLFLL